MRSFVDFIFPPTCLCCNVLMEDGRRKVCESCWSSIESLEQTHPLYLDTKEKLLATGFVNNLVSCYAFTKEGAFQKIAHALKYNGFESLGRELGGRLGARAREWNILFDAVVPVPLHAAKHRERSYNQSERIAEGISRTVGVDVLRRALVRTRHTQSQTTLTHQQRKENMENAFTVGPKYISQINGKSVLLVDDVITTGATISECARALLVAGAANVIAGSAALAQKDSGL
ncbi:MAG: ComF family protein [Ignavibacteriales bacterium]|nr:ComF family protein [Ignavibacteriales bacterium]